MNFAPFVLPLLFLVTFLVASLKKVKIYDGFCRGAAEAVPFLVGVFPYIASILILSELMEKSGVTDGLCSLLSPAFSLFGVPEELIKLVLIKPLSGNGATACFNEILEKYGADGYITRCAATIYGSSETTFYIGAVYFASVKEKRLSLAVFISLFCTFLSSVFACFICNVL